MNGDEFARCAERINEHYKALLDLDQTQLSDFLVDVIEIDLDLDRISPLFKGIVSGSMSNEEFSRAISKLHVTIGHLVPHLQSLHVILDRHLWPE